MDASLINSLHEADVEYTIVIKRMDDILKEVVYEDYNDRLILESIITNIEKTASEYIKNDKVAQLPAIGRVRKNPIRKAIRENSDNLREARKVLNKEEYKDHVRKFVIKVKDKQKEKDNKKIITNRIKSNNKKKYDTYHIKLGKAYAELFLYSILLVKEVPFNADLQEAFDNAKD